MKTTEHTPGPWRYSNGYILDGYKSVVGTYFTETAEERANGILMSKAPQMLEALQAVDVIRERIIKAIPEYKHEMDLVAGVIALLKSQRAVMAPTA